MKFAKTIDRNSSKHNVQIHLKNKDKHVKDNKINQNKKRKKGLTNGSFAKVDNELISELPNCVASATN